MPGRQYKIDAKGKRRVALSPRAMSYLLGRIAEPDKPKYRVAMDAGVPAKFASARASQWESNPFFQDKMAMLLRKEQVRPALAERDKWIARVKRRGTLAEKAEQFSAALKSDEMLVTHVPMEGLLSGKDMPAPAVWTVVSLNWGGPTDKPLVIDVEAKKE